jgi:hypothetical protein
MQTTHPDTFVPVEHRWLGLDKRAFGSVIFVIIMTSIMAGVIPYIDEQFDYDRQAVAGDVIDLGSGIRITPPVGWELSPSVIFESDEVISEDANNSASMSSGGITVDITTGPFVGTPDELLDQVVKLNETYLGTDTSVSGSRETFSTESGLTGVGQSIANPNNNGVVLAFVLGEGDKTIGLEFVLFGPSDAVSQHLDEIGQMISSLTVVPATEEPA